MDLILLLPRLKFPFDIEPSLRNLLERLLDKNPVRRITLYQLKQHPWVRGLDNVSGKGDMIWHEPQLELELVQVSEQEVASAYTSVMVIFIF